MRCLIATRLASRVERARDRSESRVLLYDDHVAAVIPDHRFGLGDVVSLQDHEPLRTLSHGLVLLDRQLDELVAAENRTLAHERLRTLLRLVATGPDRLVDLAIHRLVSRDALSRRLRHSCASRGV